ncbi:hypothetical protein GQ457_07G001610 [Hibiscus cannabinus]
MCAEKDYNNCSPRELSPVRSNTYEVNLVGENPKLRNASVSPILMEEGVSYRDVLVSIPAVVATPSVKKIEGLVVGPDSNNRSLDQVEPEAVKVPCEIGPGEVSDSWADTVDRVVNKGKVCTAKKVKVSCNLGENEADLYAEFKDRKNGSRGKRERKYGSLFDIQNQVLTDSERVNRDKVFYKTGVSKEHLQWSKLSGKSLSDSDIKAKISSLRSEARKIIKLGKKIGVQIIGEEQDTIQELVLIQGGESS